VAQEIRNCVTCKGSTFIVGSQVSIACIVTRLWMGHLRIGGSIPGTGKRFITCPKCPDQFEVPHSLMFNGSEYCVIEDKMNTPLRLRMSGAILHCPICLMHSWLAQVQL